MSPSELSANRSVSRTGRGLLALLLLVISLSLSLSQALHSWDMLLYDWGQKLAGREVPADIVIVGIDDRSLVELGRWPWPRSRHAELLDQLSAIGVQAVALDLIVSEPTANNSEEDRLLAEAIARAGNVVLPVYVGPAGSGGHLQEVLPLPIFAAAAAGLGHVHHEADADGVSRSVFLYEGLGDAHWPHMGVVLAKLAATGSDIAIPGRRPDRLTSSPYQVQRDFWNLVPFPGRNKQYDKVSYVDIIDGAVPADVLRGKTIFVGATAAGLGDQVVTPSSSENFLMSGVAVNATVFQALRSATFIRHAPLWLSLLVVSIAAVIVAYVPVFLSPRGLLVLLSSGLLVVNAAALVLLNSCAYWFPPMAISVALGLSYLFWSLLRLQQSLGYFRRELNNLAQEETFLRRPREFADLLSGLEFVALVFKLTGWRLARGDATVASWGEQEQSNYRPWVPASRWEHTGTTSTFNFYLAGQPHTLRLLWPHAVDHSRIDSATLDVLIAPYVQTAQAGQSKSPGVISQVIEQLNQGTAAFRHVSHVAQHSLSGMADGVAITDGSGRILFANEKLLAMLVPTGRPPAHLLELMQVLRPLQGEPWPEQLHRVYHLGEAIQCEAQVDSGEQVLCQVHPLKTERESNLVLCILTDISVLKEYERSRSETLNFLSHDMRSPMVSILALIENARSTSLPDNVRELLLQVEKNVNRNLHFAENFLQLARAESLDALTFAPVDMHAVVESAVAEVQPQARARGIQIMQSASAEDAWVLGNGDLLERAVTNLLANAIKFSDVDGKVSINLKCQNGLVSCAVADNGIGIPEEEQKTIFLRFNRGSRQLGRARSGAGLGLRFVEVVCERHNAKVVVHSRAGEGAVFTISLAEIDVNDF